MAAAAAVAGGSASRFRWAGGVLVVAGVAGAVLAVTGLPPSGSLVTTYGAVSTTARAVGLCAGISLLAAGAVAAWWGPSRAAGALLVGAGLLWFAADWAGWEGGPALVRGLAAVAAPLLPVTLMGLLVTLPGGRGRGVVVASCLVVGLGLGLVAVDDPFLDPVCWPTCSESGLLVSSLPALADVLAGGLAVAWTGIAAASVGGALRRLAAASPVARRWDGAFLGAIAVTGAVETVYGLATLIGTETADDAWFRALYLARAATWIILALTMVWRTYQVLGRGRALSRLASDLETASAGSLADRLRALSGDVDLDVLYPVGSDGRLVTADGSTVSIATRSGRTATPLRRRDRTVAVLVHDAVVLPVDALDAVLGPAARLALENERLAAEQLARLRDLQESQRRIVVTGDDARRRLERDLHDGAQQSLLALSYLVQVARGSAERQRDGDVVARLDGTLREVHGLLDELRGVAHGIHPAVLSQSGLAAAVRSLAEEASVPVEIGTVPAERFEPSVELAAYVAVRDAAACAVVRRAPVLTVDARREDDRLLVDLGGAGSSLPTATADRVGALGGRLMGTATGLRVELPCGS
jgi:signal transduction histidine kinase